MRQLLVAVVVGVALLLAVLLIRCLARQFIDYNQRSNGGRNDYSDHLSEITEAFFFITHMALMDYKAEAMPGLNTTSRRCEAYIVN